MKNKRRVPFIVITIFCSLLLMVSLWGYAQQLRANTTAVESAFLPLVLVNYDSNATSTLTTVPTNTPQSTLTNTPTSALTSTPTNTPTMTPSGNTPTMISSGTSTNTPTHTPTPTASATPTNTPTATPTDDASGDIYLSEWILNETGEVGPHLYSDDITQVQVNVLSAVITTVDSIDDYVFVYSSGIPNYSIVATDEDISTIADHPNGATNISPGGITVSAGDVITFGMDLGYKIVSADCGDGEGGGFSPMTGVTCRNDNDHEFYIPTDPQPETGNACGAGLEGVGYFVNGVMITSWSDANSYNNEDVWDQVAPAYREFGLDVCLGHFTSNSPTYHHHNYSRCLQEQLGDDGSGHSPIYGFIADGYPIYGPWQNDGVLAQSCWKAREYTAGTVGYCGTDNERSCLLDDEFSSAGITTTATFTAPATTDLITYPGSGNKYAAESGLYYQDYYYDQSCTDQGTRFLDEHNGHEHGIYGYHYHTTVSDNGDGTYSPKFPFTVGPIYYGDLPKREANGGVGFAVCNSTTRSIAEPAIDLGALIAPFIDLPDKQEELTFPLTLDDLYGTAESENAHGGHDHEHDHSDHSHNDHEHDHEDHIHDH